MKGIELTLAPNNQEVVVTIEPLLLDGNIEAKALYHLFKSSEYSGYFLDESATISACDAHKDAVQCDDMSPIKQVIAHAKDGEIEITIAADKMSAELTLISAYKGKFPSLNEIYTVLNRHDVRRGISKKRIRKLIQNACDAPGGRHFSDIVAKGLIPRVGKNSYIKALVPCALQRVLTPKYVQDDKIDMRDFGDILCVKKEDDIARRMPPSKGRVGFTVSGKSLPSEAGMWQAIRLGERACIDPHDENLVKANIAGLPKVSNSKIDVDNVYVMNGINIATGNINFDGSIIVNGDISERMQVIATGDITVNGFVESANLTAGGDIIVTQGTSGKLQNLDCKFTAKGTIYIGHAQGVSIEAGKDLIVDKQLAYSHIKCAGNITIGKIAKPLGKLFASTIVCAKTIRAGHLGAVSSSSLIIDYSEMYNIALTRHERLVAEYEKLASKNADHEIVISKINNRNPNRDLSEKLALLNKELELERVFLNWLRINVKESKEQLEEFDQHAKVVATSVLHAGVSIKLNKKQWLAKKDYGPCRVILEDKDWVFTPTF